MSLYLVSEFYCAIILDLWRVGGKLWHREEGRKRRSLSSKVLLCRTPQGHGVLKHFSSRSKFAVAQLLFFQLSVFSAWSTKSGTRPSSGLSSAAFSSPRRVSLTCPIYNLDTKLSKRSNVCVVKRLSARSLPKCIYLSTAKGALIWRHFYFNQRHLILNRFYFTFFGFYSVCPT